MKAEKLLLLINQITLLTNIYSFFISITEHQNIMMYINGLIVFTCMILNAIIIQQYERTVNNPKKTKLI